MANRTLPADFTEFRAAVIRAAETVEGYLSQREMEFLALLGAVPTAEGEVLEIGSFKGKSTVILAKAAQLAAPGSIVNAVDPMTAPCSTDPDLKGEESSLPDFERNIA